MQVQERDGAEADVYRERVQGRLPRVEVLIEAQAGADCHSAEEEDGVLAAEVCGEHRRGKVKRPGQRTKFKILRTNWMKPRER